MQGYKSDSVENLQGGLDSESGNKGMVFDTLFYIPFITLEVRLDSSGWCLSGGRVSQFGLYGKAEGRYFRVPRAPFLKSEKFCDQYGINTTRDSSPFDFMEDARPIHLRGVKEAGVAALLKMIFSEETSG